ncbi:hypothetical protein AUK11_03685 [bacterium CG2_30_37_16]|nr:MAG: hypothetical protein AUK11_03685 [bacterium CG2_30_37_16]PIP30480.1 MAG: hypothetical protein COX25_04415 [bacterium (Candidatus Howlettbacteria) CG23_combo_of_CG06-09_8_20_14_all_37_9]PIY00007.1 MAG: hypothetical protein COZ22_01320 [bacterium (Candidatus Howlettbacteria) CG_4_10_14_3_um_filter_37_10]PJB06014.1 MAG: hypothetical protein CO123_03020 [bacterium (Candidatus Howlettbacteria) CG_4_9_14_3_um_filter_37_10]
METKNTSALEKLSVSIVNTFFVLLISIPFYLHYGFSIRYKITLVVIFFVYNLMFIFITENRCLGMIILNIYWKEKYPRKNQVIYTFLYTLSFSTIIIWIFFPFDLLLFNLLLIQLPFVLKTGTTLHGFLSGKMSGFKLN